jgi:hypothetical protein
MNWPARFAFGFFVALLGTALWQWSQQPAVSASGNWGIDAGLTRHVPAWQLPGYQRLLADSGVGVLRERGVGSISGAPENPGIWRGDARDDFRRLKARGCRVVAFAHLPFAAKPVQRDNQLPEDLLEAYGQGWLLGREFAGLVDAWEMVGEPDIGYCIDLPDRVATYQKALYLGLKAGGREADETKSDNRKLKAKNLYSDSGFRSQVSGFPQSPIVLMGALGMPPGPWLERAAANGLFDYTDAYNFHFYGHAKDLTGVIKAHRAAMRRLLDGSYSLPGANPNNPHPLANNQRSATVLPFWITECGLNAVPKDDFLNPLRRQLQAEFTIDTARQALQAEDVAVFMPFILVHKDDPYAMTLSPYRTLPAWDAYAKFTRENPWPNRRLAREPGDVNPVVVQWLPDNRTCLPRKVGGTYRFVDGRPIRGELRIYNFAGHATRGSITLQDREVVGYEKLARVKLGDAVEAISIPAMQMKSIAIEISPISAGFFRDTVSVAFTDENGRSSTVSFGVEFPPVEGEFTEQPLPLRPLQDGVVQFPQATPYSVAGQTEAWTLINGLRAGSTEAGAVTFWIEQPASDPLRPTMAVAAIDGLPQARFLRMQLDKAMSKDCKVLLVLVDDRGQRYTIWENFGADYYGSRSDIWLNYEDIHPDFWGPMSEDYPFRPERIREVHLRFYLSTLNDPVGVKLSLLTRRAQPAIPQPSDSAEF